MHSPLHLLRPIIAVRSNRSRRNAAVSLLRCVQPIHRCIGVPRGATHPCARPGTGGAEARPWFVLLTLLSRVAADQQTCSPPFYLSRSDSVPKSLCTKLQLTSRRPTPRNLFRRLRRRSARAPSALNCWSAGHPSHGFDLRSRVHVRAPMRSPNSFEHLRRRLIIRILRHQFPAEGLP